MQEIWKDIIIEKNGVLYDYTGLYQVSNLGRVKILENKNTGKKERLAKLAPSKNGYVQIGLNKNGEQTKFYVHRLVATMFIPNPNNLTQVNHKDENRENNYIDNLEWCTCEYNLNYGDRRKRQGESFKGKMSNEKHPKARKVLCVETGQVFNSIKDAQQWCGAKCGISGCCRGVRKTASGYHWQYVD